MAEANLDDLSARMLLEADRRATEQRLASLITEVEEIVDASYRSNADDEHDPEGSTVAFERQGAASRRDAAVAHLAAIDDALLAVAAGTYGICRVCGGPIGDERLRAQPSASCCIACASRAEGPSRSAVVRRASQ